MLSMLQASVMRVPGVAGGSAICEACTSFLEALTAEREDDGVKYTGLIYWGPLLAWAWMMGRTFSDRAGYREPDLLTGDWQKIAEDAISGIEKVGALVLGLRFDLACGPLLRTTRYTTVEARKCVCVCVCAYVLVCSVVCVCACACLRACV
jgi:hypothetical protein